MKCPVCTDTDLVMSDRKGVEIDYCPNCRGVWLDRGELDKIIERANEYEEKQYRATRPEYREQRPYDHESSSKYPYKKQKKWWMEIFD